MVSTKKTLAVTGASGFLGSHICDQALASGYEVRAIVRPTSSLQWLKSPDIRIYKGDLFDTDFLAEAFQGVSAVVHNAGALWGYYYRTNVEGTQHVLHAAKIVGIPRLVLISSIAAEGPCAQCKNRVVPNGSAAVTPYGVSKLQAEHLVGETQDIDTTILRFPMIYGPRDKQTVRIFALARKGLAVDLGPSRRFISSIFAPDAARAVVNACGMSDLPENVYFISDDGIRSFGEFSRAAARAAGVPAISLRVPYSFISLYSALATLFGIEEMALNPEQLAMFGNRYWLIGNGCARRDLKWQPEVAFEDAIRETYRWYRNKGWF